MRRHLFRPSLLLLALGAAAVLPAQAQKMSLADRVASLEQQVANNNQNVDLLNQVNVLKQEVVAQRGTIEQLQHDLAQLKQASRDQYVDLDSRLQRIETPPPDAVPPDSVAPPAATPVKPAAKPAAKKTTMTDATPAAADVAQTAAEKSAYDNATAALKAGDYVQSARLLQAFLDQYPNGTYAPNALYWLGESYYATGNYPMAADQFTALLQRYPSHDKAAGALLKLGLSQKGMGQTAQAQATLDSVIQRYPGSDPARIAGDRLHALQAGG